jgi:predicted DNA-binding transcriptional regulator YafY
VWEDRQVSIEYRDRTGTMTQRVVDAYGLVSKAGVWYLVARQLDGEFRTFRVERIARGDELSTLFTRDEHFDLESHWHQSNAAMRPPEWYNATLYAANDALEWIMSYNTCEVISEDDAGKTLRMRFPSFRDAVSQVAGWGINVRVLEPAELLQALATHARELLAVYE